MSYVKIPLRSSAILNIENIDKYCLLWSTLAYLHLCNNSHPTRVKNYLQNFNELNIIGSDFSNGFKCSDMHKFEKLNNLAINIFELNFYQDKNKCKHILIPIEISKNESDGAVDLLIYKNHYALIKKLNAFLADHIKNCVCRQSLNSYTSKNILIIDNPKCENYNITTIRASNESHLHWKNHIHKNTLYFRIYADFETDKEIDNSSICHKTTNIYKQNPELNGYRIQPELEDVLKSGHYEPPLGFDNAARCVKELIELEYKEVFYFRKTKNDIIMTEENEQDFKNINICRFCEKEILSDKDHDHCHLTGKYRSPAHSKFNLNVTQDKRKFIPFVFHNFSNYDCHMFF